MAKKRLDVLLFEKGLCPSRERAKTAIMEGIVYIAGQKAGKAGDMVDENAELEVRGNDNAFVSRGGKKIEKALNYFAIDPSGLTVMDVGASTGGFTDCLLQQDDITLIERKDYIKNPKKNGYRSLHLIIEVPIFLQNEKKIMKAEVQLRTIAMEFWANLEHQLRYKKDLSPELMEQTSYQLSECARLSAVLDEQMQAIRDIIEKEEDSSEKNDSPKKPSDRLSRPILSALENYAPKAE